MDSGTDVGVVVIIDGVECTTGPGAKLEILDCAVFDEVSGEVLLGVLFGKLLLG